MKISIIAAIASNRAIGKGNDLLWTLPVDMKFFQQKTMGHHVLMGRKNFLSIPEKYRPLAGRTNIVISRREDYVAPGAVVFPSIPEGIAWAREQGESELYIIGGGQIYEQTMDRADCLYITHVHASFEADTFFPEIDFNTWKLVEERKRPADEKNPFDLTFSSYTRESNFQN